MPKTHTIDTPWGALTVRRCYSREEVVSALRETLLPGRKLVDVARGCRFSHSALSTWRQKLYPHFTRLPHERKRGQCFLSALVRYASTHGLSGKVALEISACMDEAGYSEREINEFLLRLWVPPPVKREAVRVNPGKAREVAYRRGGRHVYR